MLVAHYIENRDFKMDPYEIFSHLGIEDDEISSEVMHEIESFIHLYSSRMIVSANKVKEECILSESGFEAYLNIRELDPIN